MFRPLPSVYSAKFAPVPVLLTLKVRLVNTELAPRLELVLVCAAPLDVVSVTVWTTVKASIKAACAVLDMAKAAAIAVTNKIGFMGFPFLSGVKI